MAYIDQEQKSRLAPAIKAILRKHGVKASLSVHNYSTLTLTISSAPIDFIGNLNTIAERKNDAHFIRAEGSLDVNPYWYQEHFDGEALAFFSELIPAMNIGNHNRSDIMTDYHDVGWYVSVKVGRWDKPFQLLVDVRKPDPEWEKRMLTLTEKERS